jgi:antitoxin component YwqK of YwqJK toxin-antitoxin module
MKRLISLLAFLPLVVFSTGELPLQSTVVFEQEIVDPEGYPNKEDEKGRQGMWTIWGRMMPEKGYPDNGKIEEGGYIDGRKNGTWIKFHKDGKTPRLKGDYIDNRPNGAYVKYYENGQAMEEGTFSSGKHVEVFKRYYEDGAIAQEKTFNAEGKEEGVIRYYYPNGQVEFEYTKKNGVTVGKAVRYYENGDVKEELVYAEDGSVSQREEKDRVNPAIDAPDEPATVVSNAPDGKSGSTKDGKEFKSNGYNKVYNSDEELWMDGEFKKGKLWDGKLYKYDSDGILLKIEIWKKGAYHSDGQL